ncbi:hypothetical protein [Mycobacterium sp. 1274761.0]|uniref:hypothetical protein n=1 Tax=Mycobacterium sp. 1274761.0 TaxID=1834077 RepID=UPI0009ED2C40|nr:hypothetical protein [Mycobacterium sp. 1274761.0]
MQKIMMTAAAAAMLLGTLTTAPVSMAALPTDDTVYIQPAPRPKFEALDCHGTTGAMGCGPGWFWRDGWRGWACYPC